MAGSRDGGQEHEGESRQARQLALGLVELGEARDATERQLLRWGYHPEIATDAVMWAWTRHCSARQATPEA